MKATVRSFACLEIHTSTMIKSIFVSLNAVLSLVIFIYLHAILCVRDSSGNLAHSIAARFWGRWVLLCSGVKVRVQGLEYILKDRPQIFFCNHNSLMDIPCLQAYLPAQYRWLAKKELFSIPFFGSSMARGGYIPVDRSNPRKAYESMVAAIQHVKSGTSLVIFPEGTRSPDGRLQPFKTGGASLAIQAQVPVVPMVIKGTERILPKGTLRITGGPAEIKIGKPITTEGFKPADKFRLSDKIREAMLGLLNE
jgi:1-acyl-sn-glycerol-3-phosphate acyltransferase